MDVSLDKKKFEQEPENDDRDGNHDQPSKPKRRAEVHCRQNEKRRQHDELALGKVDGLRRLPDQREADGDEGIDRTGREPGYQKLDKGSHRWRRLVPAGSIRRAVTAGSGRSRSLSSP